MDSTETTSAAVVEQAPHKASFFKQMMGLPSNFWCACSMEILERLAFFGSRAVAPLFLVASSGDNGLGLNYKEKGIIYTVWALLQCLIPMVSGGYTDRYGYRKSLCVAFFINILGYTCMAMSGDIAGRLAEQGWQDAGFWVFLAAACMVATGTAIFKPPAHGTIAASTTEETSSMGWSVFYWVVNIGGVIAPMGAATLRGEIDWHLVFYAAAIVTALNFIPAFIWYREPAREAPQGEEVADKKPKNAFGVFWESITTILLDVRLIVFLAIFSCFWLMFMQLWDLLPNFIDEWVDTSDVAPYFAWIREGWVLSNGQVKPEMIINIDAAGIILFVIVVSWILRKVNKVVAMVVGMIIALVGFVGAGATALGWICCLMVFIFSIGEMACSPTFSAYVGLIAPKGKKALYMGYSNIPFAIGWALGGLIGGYVYDAQSSKHNLARDYMVQELHMDAAYIENDQLLPNAQVMPLMTFVMDGGSPSEVQHAVETWANEVSLASLEAKEADTKTGEKYASILGTIEESGIRKSTQVLWDKYDPYMVWYYLGGFGLLGTFGMIVFYYATRKQVAAEQANGGA